MTPSEGYAAHALVTVGQKYLVLTLASMRAARASRGTRRRAHITIGLERIEMATNALELLEPATEGSEALRSRLIDVLGEISRMLDEAHA